MISSPIKTGICSFGMSGKLFHAPFIANHPGFEFSAIVERTTNESIIKYPSTLVYRSVEEMLLDNSLQLIIVNTPSHTHYEYAKAALLAGKNIVIEKPMVLYTKEAEELTEIANSRNLFLSVYQNRRYDGDFRAMKDVVEQNLLGELREVEFRFDRYRPVFNGKVHKEGNLPGAGTLYDLGPHLIDQALQLFGWPKAVFADVWKMRDDVEAVDYFELLLYYDRLRVRVKATCFARETYHAYILHGSKGSFLQHRSDMQEQLLLAGRVPSIDPWCPPLEGPDGILHTEIKGELSRTETTSIPGNYMKYFDEVYHALHGRAANPVPGEHAIKTARIIEFALKSSKEGKLISTTIAE
jgi:scyllo-inositol 2-dehydrogenase (NADP+)